MKQTVNLLRIFTYAEHSCHIKRKTKNICLFYRKKSDKENKTVGNISRFHDQNIFAKELQETMADVSAGASYPGIGPLPCSYFSSPNTNSRCTQECDSLQECKEITLLHIC